MLALWLLASHLVGDFIFQTRWQATGKFTDTGLRARHCWTYTLAFVPVALHRDWAWGQPHPGWAWRGPLFLTLLWLLHYATDSRRFHSTLGDVITWRLSGRAWSTAGECRNCGAPEGEEGTGRCGPFLYDPTLSSCHPRYRVPLGANPWEPLPILIDQALHVVQIAALAWLIA